MQQHEWNMEDILLSEISQRKTDIAWSHLYVESKNVKLLEAEGILVVTRDGVEEKGRCW